MAKIGFIGLGIMGAHMARNLIKGGHALFVNGAYPVPDDIAKSTSVVASSTAVAQAADIVVPHHQSEADPATARAAHDGATPVWAPGDRQPTD